MGVERLWNGTEVSGTVHAATDMRVASARPFDTRSTSLSSASAQSCGQHYKVVCKQPVTLADVHN